jgi:hypothetical protein
MEIVTKQQAKDRGLKRYFTGVPCKRGHICERYIQGGACIECMMLANIKNKWYENNIERAKENMHRWANANSERKKELANRWYKNNMEQAKKLASNWRKANPEKHKVYVQRWRKANPEKHKVYVQRWRKVNEKDRQQATPSWINVHNLLAIFSCCPIGYHVDHIVPIKGITPQGWNVSGLNVPYNLQYLPANKNLTKKNRMTQRCYEIACSLKKEI